MSGSLPKLRASTACPACHQRHVLDIEMHMAAGPLGEFSLAGERMKLSARLGWRYRCTNCGRTGAAEGPDGLAPDRILGLPDKECGHVAATAHAGTPDREHSLEFCPGCCEACIAAKEAARNRRTQP